MAGATSGMGMALSLIQSFLGNKADNKQIEDQNKANKAAWALSLAALRDQLTTAYQRTQTSIQEVNRDRINNKIAVKKAGISAKGTARVQAAHLGIQGRRGSSAVKSIEREEANQLSQINIDAAIEETNIVNTFNDAANAAVANLNNQIPYAAPTKSTSVMLTEALGTGLDYYSDLSKNQRTDFKGIFQTDQVKLDKLEAPQLVALGGR